MRIEIVNPIEVSDWDEQIKKLPESTFFHSAQWSKVLSCAYGYTPLFFTVREEGRIKALVPLMEIRSFLTGKRGVALPFTDSCPPIIMENVEGETLRDFINDFGAGAGWKYYEIRGGDGLQTTLQPTSWCYEHILELTKDTDSVFKKLRSSHKRNIKKAVKAGVEIHMADSIEAVRDFYRLNVITRKGHGLPPQPFSFFEHLHREVISKGDGLLCMASFQGNIVAGILCLHFGDKAIYKYGASDPDFRHLRANNLVMWKAIEWYSNKGYKSLNLGRTDEGHEGLRLYKTGWSAKENIVSYYRHNYGGGAPKDAVVKVDGIHTHIFRRMPPLFLKALGTVLYKHIG